MKILAVETSCDDTGIAIVKASKKGSFDILSNIVSSQIEIHKKYGGVYPMLAKREHQRNLLPVLIRALRKSKLLKISNFQIPISNKLQPYGVLPASGDPVSGRPANSKFQKLEKILEREEFLYKKLIAFLQKYKKPKIDLIAVTIGPGLEPCLWVGTNFAKALSYFWNIPIVPVNHIEAHILANFVGGKEQETGNRKQIFPAVCLVVSGGHTQLILMRNFGKYKILGETRDDAAGECFDKTARILGLGYPGGPAIAAEAAKLKATSYKLKTKLPRPMINTKDYDFSFSGLKTAVLYDHLKKSAKMKKDKNYIRAMAAEIQQSVIDVLIKKTINAAMNYEAKTIILGGGVAANKELHKQFAEKIKKNLLNTQYLIPNTQLCTDNALMVAIAGYFKILYNHTLAKKGSERSEDSYFKYRNPSTHSGQVWKNIEVNANLRIE